MEHGNYVIGKILVTYFVQVKNVPLQTSFTSYYINIMNFELACFKIHMLIYTYNIRELSHVA